MSRLHVPSCEYVLSVIVALAPWVASRIGTAPMQLWGTVYYLELLWLAWFLLSYKVRSSESAAAAEKVPVPPGWWSAHVEGVASVKKTSKALQSSEKLFFPFFMHLQNTISGIIRHLMTRYRWRRHYSTTKPRASSLKYTYIFNRLPLTIIPHYFQVIPSIGSVWCLFFTPGGCRFCLVCTLMASFVHHCCFLRLRFRRILCYCCWHVLRWPMQRFCSARGVSDITL